MTRIISALTALLLLALAPPAHADHTRGHESDQTTVTNGTTTFDLQNTQNTDPVGTDGVSNISDPETPTKPNTPQPEVTYVPICLRGDPALQGSGFGCPSGEHVTCGDGGLLFTMHVTFPDETPPYSSTECVEPGDPGGGQQTPQIDIPGEALSAFKNADLPESTINIQPPGGETLVNFKTILSTKAERHQIPVHLDKFKMDLVLEVWPSHFLWQHGDGTTQESTIAGNLWTNNADVDGEGFITHVYTKTLKAAQVSVDTTWSAQFKVVGEPDWRPVNGTVTKVGGPVSLAVREATPELVTKPN